MTLSYLKVICQSDVSKASVHVSVMCRDLLPALKCGASDALSKRHLVMFCLVFNIVNTSTDVVMSDGE